MANRSYHDKEKHNNLIRLREIISTLPEFCFEFFLGIENNTAPRTRIAYGYDLRIFFDYILEYKYKKKTLETLTLKDLENISPEDIERYSEYLNYYRRLDKKTGNYIEHENDEKGKLRKLSAIRTLYRYFYKKRKIEKNPSELINMPKIHDKNIVRLEADEVANLLDIVETGRGLTDAQLKFHEKTKLRDLALVTTLLGTGIRVSECVGINVTDIDFKINGIKITRKGGSESVVYFGNEVKDSILNYLDNRSSHSKVIEAEALFLSLQGKRLTTRAVQNIVKKYSKLVTSLKNISPHKLRSTYGTSLYRATGDIYLVADVLGHRDVNTTKKHYAQISDDIRRKAANAVKLREE
ncbi:MAG: tyrosine-type recombinase/integrase [Clostridia bacterium]|jgi:site-specific recombinase XerD|nr:tyrosine-type recombinase/integrase [Clostridia bacterium]